MAGDLRLFDERQGKYVDALYAVLVASDELQFFPEMCDIFGEREVMSFLEIFAGQTITVPPRDVVEGKIRDVALWLSVSDEGDEAVPKLAAEYGLTEEQVREKVAALVECMERVGVTVCRSNKSAKCAERNSGH